MEQLNINSFFNLLDLKDLKEIQINVAHKMDLLFIFNDLKNLNYKKEKFIGVRGNYIDLTNTVVSFTFKYFNYDFELYIYYDQIEYIIKTESNFKVASCILEDFTEDIDEMIGCFLGYLKADLNKNKIPFNKI